MPLGQLETKNLDNAKRNKKTLDPEGFGSKKLSC